MMLVHVGGNYDPQPSLFLPPLGGDAEGGWSGGQGVKTFAAMYIAAEFLGSYCSRTRENSGDKFVIFKWD